MLHTGALGFPSWRLSLFFCYAICIFHRKKKAYEHKEKTLLCTDEATASHNEFIILMTDTICCYPHIVIYKTQKINPNNKTTKSRQQRHEDPKI